MELDLDLDMYIPIKEETSEEECPLCYFDSRFLELQHRILFRRCSKKKLYDILLEMYQKRMDHLRQQSMPVVKLVIVAVSG